MMRATPSGRDSHLVQRQQWAQEVQLAGRKERRWVVEEITAVPHRQQCLEEIQSIKEQVVLAPNLVLKAAGGVSL